jgi:hypothetical protein
VQTFYYHAYSDPYKDGKNKVKMNWGKGKQFAVRDGHFQSYNAEKKFSGMHFVEFSKGPESSGAPLTATVTFTADGQSMTVVPNKGGGNQGGSATPPSSEDGPAPALPPIGDSPKN